MSNKSIHYIVNSVQLQAPAVHNSNQNSASFDREAGGGAGAPFEALELELTLGAYTDGNHAWAVFDSPDNSTWTAVPAANLIGAGSGTGGFVAVNASAGQNAVQRCAYVGMQRYVRVQSTETGTTGLISGINAIGGFPRDLPTVASGS